MIASAGRNLLRVLVYLTNTPPPPRDVRGDDDGDDGGDVTFSI